MKIKTNKAQGHIEMIVSFLLFISALFMLFAFVNPLGNNDSRKNFEEGAKNAIIQNMTESLGKLSVISKSNSVHSYCYGTLVNQFNKTGDRILEIDSTPVPNPNPQLRLYSLYYSNFINKNIPNYYEFCELPKYSLGLYTEEDFLLIPKITGLKSNYEGNYNRVKKILKISTDFSFNFRYLNNSIAPELSVYKNTLGNIEKFARDIPVRVMDENGNINEMIIRIVLW